MADEKDTQGFEGLRSLLVSMAEAQERELSGRQQAFLGAFEKVGALYLHVSNRVSGSSLVERLQESYKDNILVTIAPDRSNQSFYDDHLDASAEAERKKNILDPFEDFIAKKSIDAVVYLCNYLCDGYQSPIFPEDAVTRWHIWKAIEAAERLQKPLIVGYLNSFCFGVQCYEREYLQDRSKRKCDVEFFNICGV